MSNPGDRTAQLLNRFKEVQASTTGARSDLRLTDMLEVEPGSTYRLVLSYDVGMADPNVRDVSKYISHITNNTVEPNLATARVHHGKRHNGVSVMVEARKITRPLADSKDESRMIPVIAGVRFMDAQLGENWVVKRAADGTQHLECERAEDVTALLQNTVTANCRVHAGMTFNDEVVAGACCPEKGDVVQFYADNAQRTGTVMSVKGQDVRVAEADGNTFIVPVVSIIEIVKKNEASAQRALDEQAAFYKEFYGEEIARGMFPAAKI